MADDSYDVVVVGAGSAGAVIAARLSEDPQLRVALLEAGGPTESIFHRAPMGMVALLPRAGKYNWGFETVPQPGLNGRRGYQPRGRGLGGSSAINAMAYVRGHRSDFDDWAAAGNVGWSFDEVLPYFCKSEGNRVHGAPLHGRNGPLKVEDVRSDNAFTQRFIDAAVQAGVPFNPDINGEEQDGVCRFQVTQDRGERCSTSRAYLTPAAHRHNLRVITEAHATRILIESGRAVGVEYERGGVRHVVRARREVVVSAGVFQSPQLLMLSGIGDSPHLQAMGIAPVQHLPGVGRNLQDHIDFVFVYHCKSLDLAGLSLAGGPHLLKQMKRWREERRGFVATNYAEAGAFLRTQPWLTRPDVQLHFILAMVEDHGRKMRLGHGFSAHVCCLRPKSRGEVRLASTDPRQAPLIDPKFLSHPDDLETLVAGFKRTRAILEQPALTSMSPKNINTAHVETDEHIRAAIRSSADSVYHPVGTCRMGTDQDAVVDAQLRVHGVDGLRVADASVMPTLIGGNTHAATVMIGERAADFIRARVS